MTARLSPSWQLERKPVSMPVLCSRVRENGASSEIEFGGWRRVQNRLPMLAPAVNKNFARNSVVEALRRESFSSQLLASQHNTQDTDHDQPCWHVAGLAGPRQEFS